MRELKGLALIAAFIALAILWIFVLVNVADKIDKQEGERIELKK